MTSLFSKPDTPPVPTADNRAAELAEAAAAERSARGRASTILTSPAGLLDSPQTASQVLLGA